MSDLPAFKEETRTSYTAPPNPGWKIGQKVDATPEGRAWLEGEKAGWKFVDAKTASPVEAYKLLVSGVVPRPIAFVSTEAENGTQNLAPFSWFNTVTSNPPTISIAITNQGNPYKDTAANIRATKQFVVNIISEPFVQNANATSIDAPPEVSEWALSGLTQAPSNFVKPPRVQESAFSLECEVYEILDIKNEAGVATTTLVIGLVKGFHIRQDVLSPSGDAIDPAKFQAVGRLGDISYGRIGDAFRLGRPSYEENKETIDGLAKGSA